MDLVSGIYGLLAFSVIVLFLGTLNYFIGRSHSDIQVAESQKQSSRCPNHKKKARRQRQAAAAAAAAAVAKVNENTNNDEEDQETKSISSEKHIEPEEDDDEDSAIQLTNENDDEFEEPVGFKNAVSSIQEVKDKKQQQPLIPVKQKIKNKTNRANSESINQSNNNNNTNLVKPQASVAPVKQNSPPISIDKSQEKYPISNETLPHYSLPPRFRQRQQKDFNNRQKSRTKKFEPMTKNHQSIEQNDYSSESESLTESSSTVPPLSAESQLSLSTDNNSSVNDFLSIFERNSFSTDELNFLLSKLTTKYLTKKQDWQHANKTDKTLERILDETYRSQAKILAIELQTEKSRFAELSKINTDLENTLRQIQQPNPHLTQYQQTILHYQMEIRRLTDENAHLVHQLHIYSMMPMTINECKQQQIVFNEQMKQLTARNHTLEQEIADGERATKQAAEIYKKSDTKKQERIEQMMNDLNKYKKIDRDLTNLQTKHNELEKDLTEKLNNLIDERDQLQTKYEQFKIQNNESNQTSDLSQLEEEFNELQTKNNLLKQQNAKITEQLNKLSLESNSSE